MIYIVTQNSTTKVHLKAEMVALYQPAARTAQPK